MIRPSVRLERNCQFHFTVPRCDTFTKHYRRRNNCAYSDRTSKTIGSKYFMMYWYNVYDTYTNCSSWHDLLMPHGLCVWPTFHDWVNIVRKKWLSLYYSTYGCYIHQTCTSCSSWHEIQMPHGDLCVSPTFHAWVTIVRKKWLSLYYITVPMGATFTKLAPAVHLDMKYRCHMVVCVFDLHFTLEWPLLGRNG